MVMKTTPEDKLNLFLELVAWRQLGFNAFKIPPRLQCIRYTGTSSNKHTLAPNVGQKASYLRTTRIIQTNERHVDPVGWRLKLEQ